MSCSLEQRRSWIQPNQPNLSVRRQCALLGLAAASYYYQATPESAENLLYQRLLDEEYTRHPFYGVRKMTVWLRLQHHLVGPKRVRRLLRAMGLMAVYPKPRLSLNPLAHQRFPYLLKGLAIVRPNQVWSTDITYIRLRGGFVYLAAVIDWFSRYVLAWELSTTLEVGFCVAVGAGVGPASPPHTRDTPAPGGGARPPAPRPGGAGGGGGGGRGGGGGGV